MAAAATQVEVNAVAPLVEDTKTDVSQVIDARQIQDLPINGRRVDSFVLLTPGVTNDGTFGLLSFRGVAGGNSFLVDGNDTTEQFYNENAGRTRIATQISQDAVQEFQVSPPTSPPNTGAPWAAWSTPSPGAAPTICTAPLTGSSATAR